MANKALKFTAGLIVATAATRILELTIRKIVKNMKRKKRESK